MPSEEELESQLGEIHSSIAAQGLKVKGLKDQVKEKKKAKVRRPRAGSLHKWTNDSCEQFAELVHCAK
jgi:hypothetical protein